MTYDQGSESGGRPKCLHHRLAPHPHAVDELTSWEKKDRHNSTQKNMFFMDSSLHGVHFAAFQLRPYPIFRNTALSLME